MKKLFTIILIGFISLQFANAQEIGIRVGDVVGGNAAIDFVMPFKAGRLHADVSFGNGVGIEALYDFLFNEIGSGFYYYVGLGAYTVIGDPFRLGIVGEAGLEYRFEGAPIAVGLDWRPSFQILDNTDFHVGGFGVNARWVF
jgi:hypothetical protein